MAMSIEKNIGANQCTAGGPMLVQANPKRPIVSKGAAIGVGQHGYSKLGREILLTKEEPPEP